MSNENFNNEESNINEEAIKTQSIKAKPSTRDALVQFAKEQGINVDSGIHKLLSTYELINSKRVLPSREKEIEAFESYVFKLIDIYKTSLEINLNSEEIAKENFIKQLESKDDVIIGLQTELKNSNEEVSSLKRTVNEINLELKEALNEVDKISKDSEKRISELEGILNDKDKQLEDKDKAEKINYNYIQELLDKIDKYNGLENEVSQLKETIERNNKEKDELTIKNKGLELSLVNKEQRIVDLESQCREYKEDNTALKEELRETRTENKEHIKELEVQRHNDIKELEAQRYNDMENMNKRFTTELNEKVEIRVGSITNNYESQILELRKTISKLEGELGARKRTRNQDKENK